MSELDELGLGPGGFVRETGWYWVKRKGRVKWCIAAWVRKTKHWWLAGYEEGFIDAEFDVIGEKIKEPE
jgi:hypothetical protein